MQQSKSRKNRSRNNNWLKWLVIAIILTSIVAVLTVWLVNRSSNAMVSNGPTADEIRQSQAIDAEKKRQSIETTPTPTPGAKGSSDTTSTPTNTAKSITMEISRQSNMVIVSTRLYGIASGTCALSITNGTKSLNKTADVIYESEFSTCAGFSIPISELGNGSWTVQVTANGSGDGASKSQNFEVN